LWPNWPENGLRQQSANAIAGIYLSGNRTISAIAGQDHIPELTDRHTSNIQP
jgi:hypothetical protein